METINIDLEQSIELQMEMVSSKKLSSVERKEKTEEFEKAFNLIFLGEPVGEYQ